MKGRRSGSDGHHWSAGGGQDAAGWQRSCGHLLRRHAGLHTALPHGTAEQGLRKQLESRRCCKKSEGFIYEKTTKKAA